MRTRREILQGAAGAGWAASAATAAAPALPTVKFGKTAVTRLIIGSNPFYGYSHFNRSLDQLMREFYTQDKRMEVLHACERNGINTWQMSWNQVVAGDMRRYRDEGGKMNLVLLADGDMMQDTRLLADAVKLGVIAVAHHGNRTDERFRAGQKQLVRDFVKAVRDAGVMAGVSTHNPGVVDTIESEGWDLDYYQTCLYRVTRTLEEARAQYGEAPLGEIYMEGDPERMCRMVRQTSKPCLVFKLFGAGRAVNTPQQIEAAFRFAFRNIKAGDPVIVGMFPKFKDEVSENAGLVRKILMS